jgi:heterotetrameric sarcosine oxidase gamma subunit
MERQARAAGARFEERDGWVVAAAYASREQETEALTRAAGWADFSHLGKLELQAEPAALQNVFLDIAGAPFELGSARRAAGAWWCPLAPTRILVVCEPSRLAPLRGQLEDALDIQGPSASLVDVTTAFAALCVMGPMAREVFARFCALDLRPQSTPVAAVLPGSVARQPGIVLCEATDRFLVLFGWAVAEYVWQQVAEAGRHLGGAPVGIDALPPLDALAPADAPVEEMRS